MLKFTLIAAILAVCSFLFTWMQAATMTRVTNRPDSLPKYKADEILANCRKHGIKGMFITAGLIIVTVIGAIITIIRW